MLRNKIENYFKDDNVSGVVITHGTDTLEETAYFLYLTINDPRPVVITGSQRPPQDFGSDVFINLRHAIYSACSEDLFNAGAVVVFNERIFTAKYVKKEHASNIQGFNVLHLATLVLSTMSVFTFFKNPVKP